MTTVRDLITDSYSEIAVLAEGEVPSAQMASLALRTLNRWMESQGLERLMAFETTRTLFDIESGFQDYAFGVGLDYDISISENFDTTWTAGPPGWTVDLNDGQIINNTTSTQSDGHSVELRNVLGTINSIPVIYKDFTFKAGAEATFSVWGWCDVAANGIVHVQCIETQNYLQSDGSWDSVGNAVFSIGTGASTFVQHTITTDLESEEVSESATLTIRISFRTAQNIAAFVFDTLAVTTDVVGVAARRPTIIDHVGLVDTSQSPDLEIPLSNITDDAWALVTQKESESTWPTHWYYNPTFPDGALTLWPVPTGTDLQGAVYIRTAITTFEDLDTTVSLPPGYERAIVKNLAIELCPAFERQPNPLLIQQAAQALGAVKRVNRQVADLSFDAGALIGHRGGYNIRSDQ